MKKNNPLRSALLIFTLAGSLAFGTTEASAKSQKNALHCNKCDIVFVKTASPAYPGGPSSKGYVVKRESARMVCPECTTKVVAWIKTGQITTKHACEACGGKLRHCKR